MAKNLQVDKFELRKLATQVLSYPHAPIKSSTVPGRKLFKLLSVAGSTLVALIALIYFWPAGDKENTPANPSIYSRLFSADGQRQDYDNNMSAFNDKLSSLSLSDVTMNDGKPTAFISMENQNPQPYFLGQEILKDAIISKIYPDQVLIQYNDSIITLYLKKTATALSLADNSGTQPEENNNSTEPQQRYYDSIERAEYFQNNVEVIPNPTGRGGYVVIKVEPMSGYGLLGVQPGDIFYHLDAAPMYDAIEGANGLVVYRHGERVLLK